MAILLVLLTAITTPVIASFVTWRFLPVLALILATVVFPGRNLAEGIPLSVVVVALCAVLSLAESKGQTFPLTFLPFVIFLVVLQLSHWQYFGDGWNRITDLVLAIGAWAAGGLAARAIMIDIRAQRALSLVILGAILLQAAVTGLQTAGFEVFMSTGPNEELTAGRAAGTFSHPGNLGKVMVLMALIALPLTRSIDIATRSSSTLALLLTFVPVGLSASRANFVALVSLTLLWAALLPREGSRLAKFGVPLGTLAVTLAFIEPIIQRFQSDPEGGARNHLMDVALSHIGENLLVGVGPGMYVSYFGQFDMVTAQGWPVHNVFVLQTAELGLIGSLLLFIPLLFLPLFLAFRRRKSLSIRGDAARAILSAAPAIAVIGFTGWSLTSGDVALVLFFCVGLLSWLLKSPPVSQNIVNVESPASLGRD